MKEFLISILFTIILSGYCPVAGQNGNEFLLDPAVRHGKLQNGMTYYIKYNNMPEDRAEFYLVTRAGAVEEDDDQNGLAHFVEHMCFQGTENLPGKTLLEYFKSIGMEMGSGINAGTSTDYTRYMLMQTPVNRKGIIDTALLALYDMAGQVLFEGDEIEAERGGIKEEGRTRKNSQSRLEGELRPIKYKASKYAERDVIGDLAVLKNFSHDRLVEYYKDWYRPDLQAIIVVGDVDVDYIETKIKALFSRLTATGRGPQKITFEVPDNKEPLVGIATDREAANILFNTYYKHDRVSPEEKDSLYYVESYKRNLITEVMIQRLRELTRIENPPYIDSYCYFGRYAGDKEAYITGAMLLESKITDGIYRIFTETERLKRHGVTPGELERAKMVLMARIEKQFKERDQQHSRAVASRLSYHFLYNDPLPSAADELELANEILNEMSIDDINSLVKAWITDNNLVVTLTGPESDSIRMPSKEEICKLLEKARVTDIEPYVDEAGDRKLFESLPSPGRVVDEGEGPVPGTRTWTLANGIKVLLYPTSHKDDEILIYAFSEGGLSKYELKDIPSAYFSSAIARASGIADISQTNLNKLLAGKILFVNPYINSYYEGFNGSCSPDDLETALQLINLYFSKPAFDEAACRTLLSRYENMVKTRSLNPDAAFADSVYSIRFNRNPRKSAITLETITKTDFSRAKTIFGERFSHPEDFTFIFTGNIDIEKSRDLIETYLGGLNGGKLHEKWTNDNVIHPQGRVQVLLEKELEVPKARSYINYHGEFTDKPGNRIMMEAIALILKDRYTRIIREEEGGTYGVSVNSAFEHIPAPHFELSMMFDCDPKKADRFRAVIHQEVMNLINMGPMESELQMAKEVMLKKNEANAKNNSFWLGTLELCLKNGEPYISQEAFAELVNDLNPVDIKNVAGKFLDTENIIEVVMHPPEN